MNSASTNGNAERRRSEERLKAHRGKKVWTTVVTNNAYLSGVFTLDYSLRKHKSAYPLIVLYTDELRPDGYEAVTKRGILSQRVEYLLPSVQKDYSNDPRFHACWTKLTPFSLTEYERVVQLDSDMLVLQNMDELMDVDLDPPGAEGKGSKVFAASHACVCNPLHKAHYPEDWIPENCPFTKQHSNPIEAQIRGVPSETGLGMPNGGLLVVNPSRALYEIILAQLQKGSATQDYDFADQSLLSDLFYGNWVALPYIYNALKTMRWEGVHDKIWRDDRVKNVHYILSPKPWDQERNAEHSYMHQLWWNNTEERYKQEKELGIEDGF